MTSYADSISGPDYRPSNVRVETRDVIRWGKPAKSYVVIDFDGTELQAFETYAAADDRRRNRAGVIKAALTRRANKARG